MGTLIYGDMFVPESSLPELPKASHTNSKKTFVATTKHRNKKQKRTNIDDHIWRPHITDNDENGECQYNLLLCTLKYSLISSAVQLYHNDALDVDDDKFYGFITKSAQRQTLQYLFECFFDFLGGYTDFVSFKVFQTGIKNKCKISFDRQDVLVLSFQQLAATFNGTKMFITKTSFVSWIIDKIYNITQNNIKYTNYKKHYHRFYKWIEHDLFGLVNNKNYQ